MSDRLHFLQESKQVDTTPLKHIQLRHAKTTDFTLFSELGSKQTTTKIYENKNWKKNCVHSSPYITTANNFDWVDDNLQKLYHLKFFFILVLPLKIGQDQCSHYERVTLKGGLLLCKFGRPCYGNTQQSSFNHRRLRTSTISEYNHSRDSCQSKPKTNKRKRTLKEDLIWNWKKQEAGLKSDLGKELSPGMGSMVRVFCWTHCCTRSASCAHMTRQHSTQIPSYYEQCIHFERNKVMWVSYFF